MINKLVILIFKLTLYPWVYLKRRKASRTGEIKSLLLVNTTGIGDTILSTPAWRALRNKFPKAYLTLLIHKRRREVVVNNPLVDNIISYRKFVDFWRIVRELRPLHLDAAIIFHGNDPDILPIVFLGGAREIIGYRHRTKLPYFLTHPLAKLPGHFIKAQLGLAATLGGKDDNLKPVFSLSEREREKARQFLEEKGLGGKFIVGILPGAGKPYKRWPIERFGAVVCYFLKKPDTAGIIFGSKEEVPLARKIEALVTETGVTPPETFFRKPILAAGFLNLRETAALLERLNLFITNDSGPLHIAQSLRVPTVALFGPTDPAGLLPPGENGLLKIVKKDLTCQPCRTKKCRYPFCLEQISIEEVIKAAEELIRENSTQ